MLFNRFDLKNLNGVDGAREVVSQAFSDAAAILGKQYTIYRAATIQNMLDPSNIVGQQNASFNLNWRNININTEPFQQYIAITDLEAVQPGDMFNDGNETFVLVWNRALDQAIAYKVDFMVEVWRSVIQNINDGNGLTQKVTLYAQNVPASFASKPSVVDFNMQNVKVPAQAPTWDVRIWTDAEKIQPSDQIRRVEDGLWLQPISIQNNKHYQVLTCKSVTPHGQ
jgi:hypothetical protein